MNGGLDIRHGADLPALPDGFDGEDGRRAAGAQ